MLLVTALSVHLATAGVPTPVADCPVTPVAQVCPATRQAAATAQATPGAGTAPDETATQNAAADRPTLTTAPRDMTSNQNAAADSPTRFTAARYETSPQSAAAHGPTLAAATGDGTATAAVIPVRLASPMTAASGHVPPLAALIAAALAGLFLLHRGILAPLARVQADLQGLLSDGPIPPAALSPARPRLPSIATLRRCADALTEAATRRDSLQTELARLSDRAMAENRQMSADLAAAAEIQRGQLPASPRRFPAGVMHALFRPSGVVAGDTYDCITLPDGRTRLFQIDVAGHGAPAALVSVASHLAVKQALLAAPADEDLGTILGKVNAVWSEDLPYFTLLAVEIDPATATAHFVQCGHPPLLRLPAEGGVEVLGRGGLPIGVLPDATFLPRSCAFRPGDRLVLATDGIAEAADPTQREFGDDRLRSLLAAHGADPVDRLIASVERALFDWSGAERPDDDITLIVVEAL